MPARILVVDDDVFNRDVLTLFLRGLGHDVELAKDGAEGVRAVAAGRFDLVLMDVRMPGMDGYAAARAIRAGEPRRLPVVAVTASRDDGERERCLVAGMDDYLSKPVDPELLAQTVAHWLARPIRAPLHLDRRRGPALDPEMLRELRLLRDEAGPEAIAELFEIFLAELPERLSALRGALDAGATGELRRTAHTMIGTCGTVGALGLSEICCWFEQLVVRSELADLGEALGEVQREADRVVTALRELDWAGEYN